MARPDRDRAALIVFCAVCMALATVTACCCGSAYKVETICTYAALNTSINWAENLKSEKIKFRGGGQIRTADLLLVGQAS